MIYIQVLANDYMQVSRKVKLSNVTPYGYVIQATDHGDRLHPASSPTMTKLGYQFEKCYTVQNLSDPWREISQI